MATIYATWKIWAYIASVWTDISAQVLDIDNVTAEWGIKGDGPIDFVASTGALKFCMRNTNSQYIPDHANAITGWKKGIPIKIVFTYDGEEYIRFRGVLNDIKLILDDPFNNYIKVTVLDWMDYAAEHSVVNPGFQENQRGNQVIDTTLALMPITPQSRSLDIGNEVFPTVFDTNTSKTKAYDEFEKVASSELGYIYLRKNKANGEQLVFENSSKRNGARVPTSIPLVNSLSGKLKLETNDYLLLESGDKLLLNEGESLELSNNAAVMNYDVDYGQDLINRFAIYILPRELSSSQLLFSLSEPFLLPTLSVTTLTGNYTDADTGLPITGQDVLTPVQGVDWIASNDNDGSDWTANLDVDFTPGTDGFSAVIDNRNDISRAHMDTFNVYGTGIHILSPIEYIATDSDSIDEFGMRSENLTQNYKNSLASGANFAERIVSEEAQPRTKLHRIFMKANRSITAMQMFLNADCGDMVHVVETRSGVDDYYYIQGVSFQLLPANIIFFDWYLRETPTINDYTPLSIEFDNDNVFGGDNDNDAVDFGNISSMCNQENRTFAAWVYMATAPGTGINFTIAALGGVDDQAGCQMWVREDRYLEFFAYSVGNDGLTSSIDVLSPINSIPLTTWTHVAVTFHVGDIPKMYINGTLQATTNTGTGGPLLKDETGISFVVGNQGQQFTKSFDGEIKDVQVYNRILSQAEIAAIAAATVSYYPEGVVFLGPYFPDGESASYYNQTLTTTNRVRDGVSFFYGTANGTPIGRQI